MTHRLLRANLWAWLLLTPALAVLLAVTLPDRPVAPVPDVFPAFLSTPEPEGR